MTVFSVLLPGNYGAPSGMPPYWTATGGRGNHSRYEHAGKDVPGQGHQNSATTLELDKFSLVGLTAKARRNQYLIRGLNAVLITNTRMRRHAE